MATGNPRTKWTTDTVPSLSGEHLETEISLSYAGKATVGEILFTPPANPTVIWTENCESPNRLYYGDNLPLLAALLNDSTVRGKIKLIYIDPPFATNSVFHSRNQKDAYQDLLVGATFIEFMRKRLILLRELLAEDGSIYVHLDDNMAFYIKVAMDEVFGVQNFRNWITRRKCSHKNYTKKSYGNIADYILFYTKSDQYVWNRPLEEWTTERASKEYTYTEEGTGRRYKKVPIHAPGTRNGETGQPWRGMSPPPGKHWQYTPKTLDEMDKRGEIYWSATGNPRRKIYLDNSDGVPVQDIWYDFRDTRNQNVHTTGYPTEKNPQLLERIIGASSNPGDLVLDCFSGSGTTLAVAEMFGRCWIGMDRSNEAITATLQRFVKGTERMGDFVQRDKDLQNEDSKEQQLGLFTNGVALETSPSAHKIRNFTLYCDNQSYESKHVADWRRVLEE